MVTMTESIQRAEGGSVVLHDVSWDFYERLLEEIGNQNLFVTFDEGSLEIMSPSTPHEKYKTLIGDLITILTLELRISMEGHGSTTFKRRELSKGLEPDECYYIQNVARIRGKESIDLNIDPPPDLVVEVDITSRSIAREPIYRALRVPELWRYDGLKLTMLHLDEAGEYHPQPRSRAFPSLEANQLERFLKLLPTMDHTDLRLAFQGWLKKGMPGAQRQ